MNHLFELVKRDHDSSQFPQWYDPMTLRALCRIVNEIVKGEIKKQEFEDFAKEHLSNESFAEGATRFVENCVMYFQSEGAY